ncbi:hypothetical protein Back2_10610 [Nocardioides baekrokdamisoli]|uniref:Uncharacterized protein n=1 Tax=Nocardioides baekrokdamisoli TaxID=1804624 RepID=A0A3G9IZY7_9ACTN|nr:hypothetical protein [Nocardioides baekrokdamisoli]BBH16774.1 hypothetical protein Back2_10610 [Nocardioides baekrokdamisoli]
MRRFASLVVVVIVVGSAQWLGLTPAHAITSMSLPAGQAMYVLDYTGASWVDTDLQNGHFVSTGSAAVDSANDYAPNSMAYNPADRTVYVLEWSAFGRRIERLDPSTGRRWGSVQLNEPEGLDWIDSIAIGSGGQIYGLGDQGGLYSIALGATSAGVEKKGSTGLSGPQDSLAFDASGTFLFALDPATRTIKWLSTSDGSTIQTNTTNLPTLGSGKTAVSMHIDSVGNFWVGIQDSNGELTTTYEGLQSGTTITFSHAENYWNVAGSNPTPGLSAPVYAGAMVIAPQTDTTTVAHTQSAGQVTYGGAVKFSMTATNTSTHTPLAGVTAQLQRWTGSAWAGVKNVITSGTGAASLTFAQTISTTYRWYASGRTAAHDYFVAISPAFAVKVALLAATPTISGTVRHGSTLTAHPGTWKPAGITFAYQWYVNGVAVGGATKSTLTLSSGWIGRKISVHVTGKKTGYVTVARSSASTGAVA